LRFEVLEAEVAAAAPVSVQVRFAVGHARKWACWNCGRRSPRLSHYWAGKKQKAGDCRSRKDRSGDPVFPGADFHPARIRRIGRVRNAEDIGA
jgi:hypothetical protein